MIGEHFNGLYLLTKVDVKSTEGAEFHKVYNVLKNDQKVKVDNENMMGRSWDKEAKHDHIRKEIVKKGYRLLTSIRIIFSALNQQCTFLVPYSVQL